MKTMLLGLSLAALPASALACGGKKTAQTTPNADQTTAAIAPDASKASPSACAKNTSFVGKNCSYTTGMMAQRVLAEGQSWSFTGLLKSTENALDSHVAAPFLVGTDVNVIGNEVIEKLASAGLTSSRVAIDGRLIEVDGVKYFVLTQYQPANS
jgi:hypothetical protein